LLLEPFFGRTFARVHLTSFHYLKQDYKVQNTQSDKQYESGQPEPISAHLETAYHHSDSGQCKCRSYKERKSAERRHRLLADLTLRRGFLDFPADFLFDEEP
jgi:hypothetical protein